MKTSFKQRAVQDGYVSADPLPSQVELSEFYKEVFFQETASVSYQAAYSDEELKWERLRGEVVIEALRQALQPGDLVNRSFMEIGCGEGFLLRAARNAKLIILGMDFTGHAIDAFHPELRPYFREGDTTQAIASLIQNGEQFNFVGIQNVLEHVVDPEELLSNMRHLLTSEGLAIIQVPNDFSRLQLAARKQGLIDTDYWFDPPMHLHYFNHQNIHTLLNKCGFKAIDVFGDFPIEFFLFNDKANYSLQPENGKSAHHARVRLDLAIAESGLPNYLEYCRGLARCQLGRNMVILAKPKS